MLKSLTALAVAAATLAGAAARADDKVNLVTVLTAAEPQTQLMTMVLNMQSMKQGASVHILLCGPAGDLALKDAPAPATAPQKPKGMSPMLRVVPLVRNLAMAARLLADDVRIMSF